MMKFSESLSRQLTELTDALDDPVTDLQAVLDVLVDDLTEVVRSFLGPCVDVWLAGDSTTLSVISPADLRLARSSLLLPLHPLTGAGPASVVVFYAGQLDAFRELAADLRRQHGLDGRVLLGRQLPRPGGDPPAATDPAQAAVIVRALGLLIDRGLPPEDSTRELDRRAAATGRTRADTARHLLETGGPGHDPDPAP